MFARRVPRPPGGRRSGSIARVLVVALTSFVDRTRLGVRVVLTGPARELLTHEAMKKAYLGEE